MTWFRREPEVHWLRGFGDDARIQHEAVAITETSLRRRLPPVNLPFLLSFSACAANSPSYSLFL
jgi:hypothetical protein